MLTSRSGICVFDQEQREEREGGGAESGQVLCVMAELELVWGEHGFTLNILLACHSGL